MNAESGLLELLMQAEAEAVGACSEAERAAWTEIAAVFRAAHTGPESAMAALDRMQMLLQTATHEVLFDPTGPRHVMALDTTEYQKLRAMLGALTARSEA